MKTVALVFVFILSSCSPKIMINGVPVREPAGPHKKENEAFLITAVVSYAFGVHFIKPKR